MKDSAPLSKLVDTLVKTVNVNEMPFLTWYALSFHENNPELRSAKFSNWP
jgi:hypothetical protein